MLEVFVVEKGIRVKGHSVETGPLVVQDQIIRFVWKTGWLEMYYSDWKKLPMTKQNIMWRLASKT